MTACPYAIDDLLPHAAPMVLLDRVVAWDNLGLTASVTVHRDTRFATPDRGVAVHIGLEWMAQACGAFAGLQSKSTGTPIRVGFLLGTRDFTADRAWFAIGETLTVSVRQVFHDAGMALFDCHIDAGTSACARARLTIFQPSDGEDMA